MVMSITELLLGPLGAANIQLSIALVSESHTTMELHGEVPGKQQSFCCLCL